MGDPVLKEQDLLQTRPRDIILGRKMTVNLNVYVNDGYGKPLKGGNPGINVNTANVYIYDLSAIDTIISTLTATVTSITNGQQISFQLDTTASPLNDYGRYVALVKFSPGSDIDIDPYYFNVCKKSNVFGGSS
jgi:hypothetical protein